jgi:hypothetical protein
MYMIAFQDRNSIGHDAAQNVFDRLVSGGVSAPAAERASYLHGMQTFCRRQLKRELTTAIDELDACNINPRRAQARELFS